MIKLMLHSPNKIFVFAPEFSMFAKTEFIKAESRRNIHQKMLGRRRAQNKLLLHTRTAG